MEKQKVNNPDEPSNHSFTMVPDFFYRRLIKVMGAIPSLLYLALLSYCHRKRYLAWPSLNTMSKEMGMAKTTIIRNLNILIKLKVIKNIAQGQSDKNHYHHNIYQILPPEKILLSLSDKKKKDGGGSETIPVGFQHATESGSEMIPHVVAERYPKHNHLNNTNITTTKEGAVAAVNCKKLKEKGEEKMRAIRERMVELDFKEAFIEKMLKDFSMKKVEEKLDLLRERRNIQKPAGWLMAALKNDYQDGRPEDIPIQVSSISEGRGSIHRARNQETGRINPSPTKTKTNSGDNNKILSTEEVKRRFKLLRHQLITNNYFRKEKNNV